MKWLPFVFLFGVIACASDGGGPDLNPPGGGTGGSQLGSTGGSFDGTAGQQSSGGAGGSVASSGGQTGSSGGSSGGTGEVGGSGGEMMGTGGDANGEDHWVGTWATANQVTEENNEPPMALANNTLRQIVRVSIGGSQLRLRISNEYGDAPVTLNSVHIANAMSGSSIDIASDKALTFSANEGVTIAPGEFVASDPIDYPLEPLTLVALTIAFGDQSGVYTGHPGSRTTSYIQSGDQVSAASINGQMTDHWYFISGIDVMAPATTHAVAILGDSITDGRGSTTNGNDRWPDRLAERFQADMTKQNIAVLNLGIGGNHVVKDGLGPPALQRYQTQIIDQPGVKWVMILEGVNDIGADATADSITSGLSTMVADMRAAGLTVYGIPILPFAGSGYDSTQHQQVRSSVNEWITAAGNFDASIPMDEAVSDGNTPPSIPDELDYQDDKLHLLPAGYLKMAEAVDLSLFD